MISPSMSPRCHQMILLTQAEIDGELAVSEAISVASHRANCLECQTAYQVIRVMRTAVRRYAVRHGAPPALRNWLLAMSPRAMPTERDPKEAAVEWPHSP